MKRVILVLTSLLVAFSMSCSKGPDKSEETSDGKYILKSIETPSQTWVGKTVQIKFGRMTGGLSNVTAIVEIKGIKKENGEDVLLTKKPYTSTGHDFIYFRWFTLGGGKGVISYKEAIPKQK